MLSKADGHLRIVDFGTAKNLDDTSLNGPNFVGTPGMWYIVCIIIIYNIIIFGLTV